MSKITIRPALDSDALTFLEILNSSIREVASDDYPPEVIESWAIPIDEKSLASYANNSEGELRILAELDGQAVGLGATVILNNELRACYVAPRGLRQGVGSSIVQELERMAKAEGLTYFQLNGTITAEPFYHALGYSSLGRIEQPTRGGLPMAAVRMKKEF